MGILKDTVPELSQIKELRDKINNIGSSPEESLRMIGSEFATEFIYHCNAISGNKTSKETTRRIIKNGPDENEKGLKSVKEITGLHNAYKKVMEMAGEPLTASKIQELHAILHGPIDPSTAGMLQAGSSINYQNELKDFAFWFNLNDLDDVHFAAEAYARYIFMHPYKGSNGRMARLLMNLALLKRQYAVVYIPSKWKKEYEECMENYNKEDFAEFVSRCVLFSQNQIVNKKGNVYSDDKKRHIRGLNVDSDVLEYIRSYPGSKTTQIKRQFTKISFTKLQRILHRLTKAGKIEFVGPTKGGGYFGKEGGKAAAGE